MKWDLGCGGVWDLALGRAQPKLPTENHVQSLPVRIMESVCASGIEIV